jgi:protein-S-isoprenylcysteine O-methyltransferase Ste14
MRVLELKVPPPAVALFIAVLMWLVSRAATAFAFTVPARNVIAILLAACGFLTSVSGVVSFWLAKTTVNPTRPLSSTSLVNSGVFKLTRNPMYLGLLVVLIGWAIFLSNPLAALLFLPAYVLYIDRFQIAPEERALTSLFGQDYVAYQTRVRRWL